jgi:hypothetical protein
MTIKSGNKLINNQRYYPTISTNINTSNNSTLLPIATKIAMHTVGLNILPLGQISIGQMAGPSADIHYIDYVYKINKFKGLRQTKKLVYSIISEDGSQLEYVNKQTPEICTLAISNYPAAIQYVKNQTEDLCRCAVTAHSICIEYVKDQTDELSLIAVKVDLHNFRKIKNPSKELMLYVLSIDARQIIYMNPPKVISQLVAEAIGYYTSDIDYVKLELAKNLFISTLK